MKNKWLKCGLVLLLFISVSAIIYFILKCCGLTDVNQLKQIILSTGQWSRMTFIILSSVCFALLCFVPLVNSAFVVVSLFIFGPIETIIMCLIANFISSSLLFVIGDKVGESLISKLIGKSNLEQIQDRLDTKSKLYLPILYIVPIIPDESLALIAGMTKMKYWYFILICMIYHLAELLLFCLFGGGIIDWHNLRAIDWIIISNLAIIDFVILKRIEKYINDKK